jgi:hypothetical protein
MLPGASVSVSVASLPGVKSCRFCGGAWGSVQLTALHVCGYNESVITLESVEISFA